MRGWFVQALALTLVAIPATAGSLGFGDIGILSRWQSTECHKPRAPIMFEPDVDTFNRYIDDVNDFTACVQREARSDKTAAIEAINRGAREIQDEVIREADSARHRLKSRF